jgi:tetratricopeptide (TPR) repeat protein
MSLEGQDLHNHSILISRFSASRQWDRTLETARDWLAKEPENPRAHLAAGQALINLDRHAEAEPHLGQVLARQPQNALAHRFMSIVQFEQKRFKAADESIEKAISLRPDDAYNWFHLARMFYYQNDLASAKKYAERARELAPRNSDIMNLLGMCEPRTQENAREKLRQYEKALELNPENATVHNNVGACHLNVTKDYREAEACFRRALYFQPSLQVARQNLFVALKHRDPVYRALCAPKDFIFKLFSFLRDRRRESLLIYLLLLPLWLVAYRFVFAGLALWFLLVWPLVKAYEYLTLGDIMARAGEIGAKRGGLFGYRRLSLKWRLSIFAVLLAAFWGGLAAGWRKSTLFATEAPAQVALGLIAFIGLLILLWFWLQAKIKKNRFMSHVRRRAKHFDRLLEPGGKKIK